LRGRAQIVRSDSRVLGTGSIPPTPNDPPAGEGNERTLGMAQAIGEQDTVEMIDFVLRDPADLCRI